jgi:two-component system chemotaxis response regulator CheB
MTAGQPLTRDIVVVGCSAGGVEAIPKLLHLMPKDLPASICIVQHISRASPHYLVDIFRRATLLAVEWAEQGAPLRHGTVYVSPADVHFLFADDHISLVGGARENHARPSIDKLFRSAAAHHGSRVIGALLTGMMEDGVAGLCAIRDAGGIVMVQDPDDAQYPELPSRALLAIEPDRVLPLLGLGQAIISLAGQPVEKMQVANELLVEAEIDRIGQVSPSTLGRIASQTPVPCPDCKGPTWLFGDEKARRYRCYQGHVISAHQVLKREDVEIQNAMWSAVRALNDRASTLETLAADSDRLGSTDIAQSYAERAREARAHAELARQFMMDVLREG